MEQKVLRGAIREFWRAADLFGLNGLRDSGTMKGCCVWINNAFGVFLSTHYYGRLHYARLEDSDVLTAVESVAGAFGSLATEHTWLRLYFGTRVIYLDLSAAQFGIAPNVAQCYLFTEDVRYVTQGAEIVSIERRWHELQQIDAMWHTMKDAHIDKLEYFHMVASNIERVLALARSLL